LFGDGHDFLNPKVKKKGSKKWAKKAQ
jgi:hypothetical protein